MIIDSMNEKASFRLRFPIGEFIKKDSYSPGERSAHIAVIRTLPAKLASAVEHFSESQLETPYREGGWNVRQVIHHIADSHINGFIRERLGLTEDTPTIRPYHEALWSELKDNRTAPITLSLGLIAGLHERWALMLESLSEEAWHRTYIHPESGIWTIEQSAADYAWHGEHHLAHITELTKRMNW